MALIGSSTLRQYKTAIRSRETFNEKYFSSAMEYLRLSISKLNEFGGSLHSSSSKKDITKFLLESLNMAEKYFNMYIKNTDPWASTPQSHDIMETPIKLSLSSQRNSRSLRNLESNSKMKNILNEYKNVASRLSSIKKKNLQLKTRSREVSLSNIINISKDGRISDFRKSDQSQLRRRETTISTRKLLNSSQSFIQKKSKEYKHKELLMKKFEAVVSQGKRLNSNIFTTKTSDSRQSRQTDINVKSNVQKPPLIKRSFDKTSDFTSSKDLDNTTVQVTAQKNSKRALKNNAGSNLRPNERTIKQYRSNNGALRPRQMTSSFSHPIFLDPNYDHSKVLKAIGGQSGIVSNGYLPGSAAHKKQIGNFFTQKRVKKSSKKYKGIKGKRLFHNDLSDNSELSSSFLASDHYRYGKKSGSNKKNLRRIAKSLSRPESLSKEIKMIDKEIFDITEIIKKVAA